MNENLIEMIENGIDAVHDMDVTHHDYAVSIAKTLAARLHECVKPLEWERADLSAWGEYAETNLGRYALTWVFGNGPKGEDTFFTLKYDGKTITSGWNFEAYEFYSFAQAHYAAQIIGGLDL